LVENYGILRLNMLEILTLLLNARLVLAHCFMLMSVCRIPVSGSRNPDIPESGIFVGYFTVGRKTIHILERVTVFPIYGKGRMERGLANSHQTRTYQRWQSSNPLMPIFRNWQVTLCFAA